VIKFFAGTVEVDRHHPGARRVRYAENPSLHACDARCRRATGERLTCQCSCGGANHGIEVKQPVRRVAAPNALDAAMARLRAL
jgi:hypothetical protein